MLLLLYCCSTLPGIPLRCKHDYKHGRTVTSLMSDCIQVCVVTPWYANTHGPECGTVLRFVTRESFVRRRFCILERYTKCPLGSPSSWSSRSSGRLRSPGSVPVQPKVSAHQRCVRDSLLLFRLPFRVSGWITGVLTSHLSSELPLRSQVSGHGDHHTAPPPLKNIPCLTNYFSKLRVS